MGAPVAVNGDTIVGVPISSASAVKTKSYGQAWILDGDPLPSHPPNTGPHVAPTAQANPNQTIIVEGKKAVRVNVDPASCGDVISPGSGNAQTVILGP
jgi:uncharacterized Zn-binding protein involved in type VI secretion